MSKITKVETYAVLWLHNNNWDIEKISQELNLTEKQIQNVLSKIDNKDKIKTKSAPVGNSPSKNLMIRETANKKSHVAIMTKESSMINDEIKKKHVQSKKNLDTPGIYRPHGK